MQPYLRLIRIPNLLFIILVQFLMHRIVIVPILQVYGLDTIVIETGSYLLISATVLIAAGGYVLNDYFDIKIDAINHPGKQIIGRTVSKQNAMRLYQILTGAGVICGLILSYLAKSYTLALIFILVPGLLWFYSSNYKRQFLTGNLVISFNTALTVLVVAITEVAFLQLHYGNLIFETPIPKNLYSWIAGFSIFAFVLTWIREIIKDMEDEKGDREMECRTMPIVWGIAKTKVFLYILIALTIVALLAVNQIFIPFEGSLTFRYIIVGLVLPLIILMYMIFKAKTSTDFHQASTLSKFIMLIGVMYCFIFYYLQAKTYGISMFGLFMVQ